jgi:hypothetical protein
MRGWLAPYLVLALGLQPGGASEPALRLVTLEDGSQVFLDWEGEIAGTLTEAAEALPEAFSAPPQVPGWPWRGGEVETTPTVADVDGDGRLDAVFASISDGDPNTYVVGADGAVKSGWPVATGRTGMTPTVADVDGDGTLEVFVATIGVLHGLREDGSNLTGWPQLGPGVFRTVAIEDLDEDGRLELAGAADGVVYLWDATGAWMPGWPFVFANPFLQASRLPAAVGDVDGDGIREIAVAMGRDPSLYLFTHDGVVRPGFPIILTLFGLKEGLSMADVGGDGRYELLFQERTGVWILDGYGNPLPGWPIPPGGGNEAPAIGDIDRDGRLELVWGTTGGPAHVFAVHDDGTAVDGWPITVPGMSFNAQATLGDVDGDGGVDVVLGGFTTGFSAAGRIFAWHADGTLAFGFPFDVPDGKAIGISSVTITDLDEDGDVDLLVGAITGIGGTNNGRVFAFDLPAPYDPSTMEWPTLGHDVRHTSRYEPPDGAPVAEAGPDLVVECTSAEGALVVLDGSASTDPDEGDGIVLFEWFEAFGLPGQVLLGTGEILEVVLPVGEHAITLRVRDGPGARRTDSLVVSVVDTVAPVLSMDLEPEELWPPNHRLVEVSATVAAADLCSTPAAVLESVTSSEPDDAPGGEDGATAGDVQGADPGTADFGMELRAERSGAGPGRTYEVTYRATDGAGNATTATAAVQVPHDQGAGPEPLLVSTRQTDIGTLLEWGEVPGAPSYRVVRGQVGSLFDTGAFYDLGPVACLASGIAVTSTAGLEDASVPSVGDSYFYLVEYDDGRPSGYGTGSAARDRVVPTGSDCR